MVGVGRIVREVRYLGRTFYGGARADEACQRLNLKCRHWIGKAAMRRVECRVNVNDNTCGPSVEIAGIRWRKAWRAFSIAVASLEKPTPKSLTSARMSARPPSRPPSSCTRRKLFTQTQPRRGAPTNPAADADPNTLLVTPDDPSQDILIRNPDGDSNVENLLAYLDAGDLAAELVEEEEAQKAEARLIELYRNNSRGHLDVDEQGKR